MFDLIIIGGGWAGCSALYTANKLGLNVLLLESTTQLGGRARSLLTNSSLNSETIEFTLDNGQHVLAGAYKTILKQLRQLGYNPNDFFKPLGVQWAVSQMNEAFKIEQFNFSAQSIQTLTTFENFMNSLQKQASALPVLLSILKSNFSLRFKYELIKFLAYLKILSKPLIIKKYCTLMADVGLQQLGIQHSMHNFFKPLCLALMNSPLQQTNFARFCLTLKDLFQDAQSMQLLLPKQGLTQTYCSLIAQTCQTIKYQQRVIGLEQIQSKHNKSQIAWQIHCIQGHIKQTYQAKKIVLATPHWVSYALLEQTNLFNLDNLDNLDNLASLQNSPITTIYLQSNQPMQTDLWVLDDFILLNVKQQSKQYLIALIASNTYLNDEDALNLSQLALMHYQKNHQNPYIHWQILKRICEKRATILTNIAPNYFKGLQKKLQVANLALAGDYVHAYYPCTLESSAHSGKRAVETLFTNQPKI